VGEEAAGARCRAGEGRGRSDRGAFLFRLARNLFHLSSIRIFWLPVFQAKSLNLLARPTGIEPVFPP
jgi:hypothetical protein